MASVVAVICCNSHNFFEPCTENLFVPYLFVLGGKNDIKSNLFSVYVSYHLIAPLLRCVIDSYFEVLCVTALLPDM